MGDDPMRATYGGSLFDGEVGLIDSNGTLYAVGEDTHGWFSIQRVERDPDDPATVYPAAALDSEDAEAPSFAGAGIDRLVDIARGL